MSNGRSRAEIEALMDASPFIVFCGMRVDSIDPDEKTIVMSMPMRVEFRRSDDGRQFHGGTIFSLVDTAACLVLLAVSDGPIASVNLTVDYLRPAAGDRVSAKASVRRQGRTFGVVDVDVFDPADRLVAIGRATISCG